MEAPKLRFRSERTLHWTWTPPAHTKSFEVIIRQEGTGFNEALVRECNGNEFVFRPPDHLLGKQLRARVRVKRTGEWSDESEVATTLDSFGGSPALDCERLSLDPFGYRRGECNSCGRCSTYLNGLDWNMNPSKARVNTPAEDHLCLKCGCSWAEHALDGEDTTKQEGKTYWEQVLSRCVEQLKQTERIFERRTGESCSVVDLGSDHKEVRVYAISDVHTDHSDNMQAVRSWSNAKWGGKDRFAILILAGDVATNVETIRQTFGLLKQAFDEVFFCPGNHDLWFSERESWASGMANATTVDKLIFLCRVCAEEGIRFMPCTFFGAKGCSLSVAPILR